MNSSLCKSNVQIAGKRFYVIFDAYISAIATIKKEKSEMKLKSSIGPSHPISETTTSHACKLKTLETRMIKNQVFF